jgi:hypothetical protein
LINEISQWILQQLQYTTDSPATDPTIVQHCIFGGILLLETHPGEEAQLAFVDSEGCAWMISTGWLLFKFAEGPGGMPFEKERIFERRRGGVVRKLGGLGGGLEGFE